MVMQMSCPLNHTIRGVWGALGHKVLEPQDGKHPGIPGSVDCTLVGGSRGFTSVVAPKL